MLHVKLLKVFKSNYFLYIIYENENIYGGTNNCHLPSPTV